MPLLPHTRRALANDLDEAETRMSQWVDELGSIVGTSVQHMSGLDAHKAKLMRLRLGFQAVQVNVNPVRNTANLE